MQTVAKSPINLGTFLPFSLQQIVTLLKTTKRCYVMEAACCRNVPVFPDVAVLIQIFGLYALELLEDLKRAKKNVIFTVGRTDVVLIMNILLLTYTNCLFIEFICCRLTTDDFNHKLLMRMNQDDEYVKDCMVK